VLNSSTGRSYATAERFPPILEGDYLEGGLTTNLILKDLRLYVELAERLGVRSLNADGAVASFELAAELGYGDQISNRVVDAIGDASGGVRIAD
jgi:3-hydroxyisobutyrate dehydrogenase